MAQQQAVAQGLRRAGRAVGVLDDDEDDSDGEGFGGAKQAPVAIVGMREHIFTKSASVVADFMAQQETVFVSSIQRVAIVTAVLVHSHVIQCCSKSRPIAPNLVVQRPRPSPLAHGTRSGASLPPLYRTRTAPVPHAPRRR